MARLIAPNGATVNVSDEKAERLLATGYRRPGGKAEKSEPPASRWAKVNKPELLAEIERRNADRADDVKIAPADDKVGTLREALDADDAATAASGD
jgi:hypothetical protein